MLPEYFVQLYLVFVALLVKNEQNHIAHLNLNRGDSTRLNISQPLFISVQFLVGMLLLLLFEYNTPTGIVLLLKGQSEFSRY